MTRKISLIARIVRECVGAAVRVCEGKACTRQEVAKAETGLPTLPSPLLPDTERRADPRETLPEGSPSRSSSVGVFCFGGGAVEFVLNVHLMVNDVSLTSYLTRELSGMRPPRVTCR